MERGRVIAIVLSLGILVVLAYGVDVWRNRAPAGPAFDFSGAIRPAEFAESPSRGAANPRVVLFEYADFACSHCAEYQGAVGRVLASHPDDVRLVWKDFPFLSQASKDAAAAARCAGEQGKFWEYANWLFANQSGLGSVPFESGAASFGLSTERFTACLADGRMQALVERDFAEGRALGITETPTLVIGDVALAGAQTFEEVERVLVPLLNNGN